ncbi:hypothetical protein FOQG_18535 [Fusarium oxysporum f. sp. raphani 54005]|uniref:Uncharacterized protein n=3 Tax=Fusarium oxysporum TaxID=5507 RepID=X0C1S7_FUSOX|nr:hypothetical protein FOVG_19279 [Fusarium oxysporum f. sp. pisi HDV247]EXK76732.1 hypothetical protein FOQG_18535 [Fusarium oxysporum f. sp. raphani 54005]KAG7423177.1 hypothetical protein Forpi1262_v015615 [Fusarium oxysporum f. sp. raphani]KAH7186475.1 hypothetical protein BKA60DRAFT_284346 [Fusarium oxysporum]KAK2666434.1 hypothetical protein RAB80_018091 [Fusarium oxysporum f. sp. vasinfectum]
MTTPETTASQYWSFRICPSVVNTLSLTSITTTPEVMRKRLTSRILPLDLDLSRRLNVVAPVNAKEPIISGRAASGVVDGVRQFSNTTSLSIFDQDAVPLNAQLQSVSNAISQGLYKSVRSGQHDLASPFGGQVAKIIHLSAQTKQLPPPYSKKTFPLPSAPTYHQSDLGEILKRSAIMAWLKFGLYLRRSKSATQEWRPWKTMIDVSKKA